MEPIGSIEVRSPDGSWHREDTVYSDADRERKLTSMREAFGREEVRFVLGFKG